MNGTKSATMGDRGRLVIPIEMRTRAGLREGTPLVLVSTEQGIVVMTRDQARAHLRAQLAGTDLVAGLLAERRRSAQAEDAE
ncbi:MAG: AbrB/MazE/SpoVT family DNA-binding domain-containing protein [Dermatophilaceae bacterium]|nr:AbrB/MazE/SpoVT family DNA-binding domain-containing protein [Intrasporangiaceae bacterium]